MVDRTVADLQFKTRTRIQGTTRIQVRIRAITRIRTTTHIRVRIQATTRIQVTIRIQQTEIAELTEIVTAISIGTIASLTGDTVGSIVTETETLIATTPGGDSKVQETVTRTVKGAFVDTVESTTPTDFRLLDTPQTRS